MRTIKRQCRWCLAKEKINDHQFTIDDDNDEYIDIGSDDDFDQVQNFLLADLLDRSDQRLAERL